MIQRIKAKGYSSDPLRNPREEFLIEKDTIRSTGRVNAAGGGAPPGRSSGRLLRGNIKTHENLYVKRDGEKLAFVSQSSLSEPTPGWFV